MLGHKIPIISSTDHRNSSAILDFTLAIIKLPQPHESCLFSLNKSSEFKTMMLPDNNLKEAFLIFPEKNLEHFSSLLSEYNASAIDVLPSYDTVNVIYGDGTVVAQYGKDSNEYEDVVKY